MSEKVDKIKQSLNSLGDHIKTSQEQNKNLVMYSSMLTIAIIGILLLFIYVFYSTIKANFSAERILTAMSEQGSKILPEISNTTVEIITQVSPKYSALIEEKALSNTSIIAKTADKELVELSDNISKKSTESLNHSILNVVEGQKKIIKNNFPTVEDKKLDELFKQMELDLNKDFIEVCDLLINKTINEFISLKKTVDTFEDKTLPSDKIELSILFLHNLILLADQEIISNLEKSKKGGK